MSIPACDVCKQLQLKIQTHFSEQFSVQKPQHFVVTHILVNHTSQMKRRENPEALWLLFTFEDLIPVSKHGRMFTFPEKGCCISRSSRHSFIPLLYVLIASFSCKLQKTWHGSVCSHLVPVAGLELWPFPLQIWSVRRWFHKTENNNSYLLI